MKTYYDMRVAFPHAPGEWCAGKSFDIYTPCCFQTPFTCDIDGERHDGEAGDLLLHSGMNIREGAVTCGFGTVYPFSKQFRWMTGVPPSRYVREKTGPR